MSESMDPAAEALCDVVAFVDVNMDDGGTTSAIWNEKLGDLGAAVTKTFTKSVTHVVWKKGKEATANKVLAAKSRGQAVKVVTVLWVDACVQTSMLADTCSYDVDLTNKEVFAKKGQRSMKPRSVDESQHEIASKKATKRKSIGTPAAAKPSCKRGRTAAAAAASQMTQETVLPDSDDDSEGSEADEFVPARSRRQQTAGKKKAAAKYKFLSDDEDEDEDEDGETVEATPRKAPGTRRKQWSVDMDEPASEDGETQAAPGGVLVDETQDPIAPFGTEEAEEETQAMMPSESIVEETMPMVLDTSRVNEDDDTEAFQTSQEPDARPVAPNTDDDGTEAFVFGNHGEEAEGEPKHKSIAKAKVASPAASLSTSVAATAVAPSPESASATAATAFTTPLPATPNAARRANNIDSGVHAMSPLDDGTASDAVSAPAPPAIAVLPAKRTARTARAGPAKSTKAKTPKRAGKRAPPMKKGAALNKRGKAAQKAVATMRTPKRTTPRKQTGAPQKKASAKQPAPQPVSSKDSSNTQKTAAAKRTTPRKQKKAGANQPAPRPRAFKDLSNTATGADTPTRKPGAPAHRFVLSGLDGADKDCVLAAIKNFNCKIDEVVTDLTTHVISGTGRTIKVMMGIARGCWVVDPAFALVSLERGKWQNEAKYERHTVFPGAKITRALREKAGAGSGSYTHKVFAGSGSVFISDKGMASAVSKLVKLTGLSTVRTTREADVILGKEPFSMRTDQVTLKPEWMFDSISRGALQSAAGYVI